MRFKQPDAIDRIREAMVDVETSGESNDEIGGPLDTGVKRTIPEYDEKLQLGLDPVPDEVRQQINGIRWGVIEREGARLTGLGDALDDIADCITSGIKQIEDGKAWEGEAFEAFKQTAGQTVQGMLVASAALKVAGKMVSHTTEKLRELYGEEGYRAFSERTFEFKGMPKSSELHLLDGETIDTIPLCGAMCHDEDNLGTGDITGLPDNMRQNGRRASARSYASMRVLTSHWLKWYGEWDGTDHAQDIGMSVSRTESECSPIAPAIILWYQMTASVKSSVSQLYDGMLEQLTSYADSDHFRRLKGEVGA
ncbi:hypothetical protein [Flindersiella endophytica]